MTAALVASALCAPAAEAAKRPDLRVAELNPPSGTTLALDAVVRNAGNKLAKRSQTGFYLSSDTTRSADDTRLARVRTRKLRRGRQARVRRTVQVPSVLTGTFRLIACTDDAREVTESREANNCRIAGGSLTVGPDVVPPPPAAPVALAATVPVPEDTALPLTLTGTDADTCELEFTIVSSPAHGTLSPLAGGACRATGDRATVTYLPATDYVGPDAFTFRVSDGARTSDATVALTVNPVNDAPTITAPAVAATATGESLAIPVSFIDPDVADAPVAVTLDAAPDGTVTLGTTAGLTFSTGDGTGDAQLVFTATRAAANEALASLSYRSTVVGTQNLGITVDDQGATGAGGARSDNRTVAVTVTANVAPEVQATPETLAYAENAPATVVDPGITVANPDGVNLVGASVQITTNLASAEDALALPLPPPGITAAYSEASGTLTLAGTATTGSYEQALRAVTYVNSSESPSDALRTVTFTVDDGGATGSDTRDVAVAPVNDPPVAAADALSTNEDIALQWLAPGLLTNDTDLDAGDTMNIVALNGFGELIGTSVEGATVTLTPDGSVIYDPAAVFHDLAAGESATDTFEYTVSDSGAAESTATVTVTVDGVSDAPVAGDDTYAVVGNTQLFVGTERPDGVAGRAVTGSVLDNDSDPDSSETVEPLSSEETALGGAVTLAADGTFTYTPPIGTRQATDSFDYTISDGAATDTGTVSLQIGERVWYVRNDAPAGGDGTSLDPLNTLAAADTTADALADTIYVFRGDGTTAGLTDAVELLTGQRVVGAADDLSVDGAVLLEAEPGQEPSLAGSIELAGSTGLTGFSLAGSGVPAIHGGPAAGPVFLSNLQVTGTAGGISLEDTSGASLLLQVSVTTTGGDALSVTGAEKVDFGPAGTVALTADGGRALSVTGTETSGSIDSATVTSSPDGGILLDDNTGSLAIDAIDLTTAGTALEVDSSEGVAIASGEIDSTGPAAVLSTVTSDPADPPDVTLGSVSSSGGANGILIDDIGAGTFSSSGGTMSGHTGVEVDVNGGSGAITYGGAIGDGSGQTAELTGRTGGSVTLAGDIADGVDEDGGIVLAGNAGTFAFSGASKVLRTGGGAGVSMTGSVSDVAFTGGGLDIGTTSGNGFTATGGGSVTVTGAGNAIASTEARALGVIGTDIGGGGLTFESISASEATHGIVLDGTGTAAGLTVTGDGITPSSGGTIEDIASRGVTLEDTVDATLRHMDLLRAAATNGADPTDAASACGALDEGQGGNLGCNAALHLVNADGVTLDDVKIDGSAQQGINGNNVTDLTITDSIVSNAGDETGEDGIRIRDLRGTSSITGSEVSDNEEAQILVLNESGSATLAVSASELAQGARGVVVAAQGTSALGLEVTGSGEQANSIHDLATDGVSGIAAGTATLDFTILDAAIADTGGASVGLTGAGGAGVTFAVNGNTALRAGGNPIEVEADSGSAATMTGTVVGNVVGTAGVENSGSTTGGSGVSLTTTGDGGTLTTRVEANTLNGTQGPLISAITRDGSSTLNVTAAGNSGDVTPGGLNPGILLQSGATSEPAIDAGTLCADISGNSTLAAEAGASDIRSRQRFNTVFQVAGLGATTSDPNVVSTLWVDRNPLIGDATATVETGAEFNAGQYVAVDSCPVP